MSDNLNIDLVFPIRDDVSARLMWIKAELLYDAGIINAKELEVVTKRAATVVECAPPGASPGSKHGAITQPSELDSAPPCVN